MSNDQLSFISLMDLMIHNMENVTSAQYSLLHIDKAMNDISLIILKDKKMQWFRVIHLIEFIQSNNFHIYSIF